MYSKILELLGLKTNKIKTQILRECFIRNLSKDEAEKVYNYYNENVIVEQTVNPDIIDIIILKLNLTTP